MRGRPARNLLGATLVCAVATVTAPAFADDAACVAASEQGLSLKQQGKLQAALAALSVCADAACPAEVTAECSKRIEAVTSAMPTLILAAKDGSGNDLFLVKVTLDGAPLVDSLNGRPISIDPGEHTFRFEMNGQAAVERKLVLREGEKGRIETVRLGIVAAAPSPPPPPVQPTGAPPSRSSWTGRKTLAVTAGGLGLVGVGLGVAFGLYASSAQSLEKTNCSSSRCTNYPQASEDYNVANKDATASTIAIVAGGALVAAGIVLWFTAPRPGWESPPSARRVHVTPAVLGRGGGLVVGGDL